MSCQRAGGQRARAPPGSAASPAFFLPSAGQSCQCCVVFSTKKIRLKVKYSIAGNTVKVLVYDLNHFSAWNLLITGTGTGTVA